MEPRCSPTARSCEDDWRARTLPAETTKEINLYAAEISLCRTHCGSHRTPLVNGAVYAGIALKLAASLVRTEARRLVS